jgi:hypothetical protein
MLCSIPVHTASIPGQQEMVAALLTNELVAQVDHVLHASVELLA